MMVAKMTFVQLDRPFGPLCDVPSDRNLTVEEIDRGLSDINNAIVRSISRSVPIIKPYSNTLRYLNRRIRKLQEDKSVLVSLLHNLHITDPHARQIFTRDIKAVHKKIVIALKAEFRSASDTYWNNLIKNIDFRNSDTFFPKINAIFRPKQRLRVKELRIHRDNGQLLNRSGCDRANAGLIEDNLVFTTPGDKLNILGAYYESINSPRYLNSDSRLKELVDTSVATLRDRSQ